MAETFLKLGEVFKYLGASPDSRCFVEGEQVLNAKHLILCGRKASDTSNYVNVIGLCLQTSALQSKPHEIEGKFLIEGNAVSVKVMKCSCKAGLSGTCKHVSAVLLYCTRTNISLLEILSTTDVECYWGKMKLNAKEKYIAQPISDYSCLETVIKRRKVVRSLTNEEANSCAKELLDVLPRCSMKKHCLGRRSVRTTTAANSKNADILPCQGTLFNIDKCVEHFCSSPFLLNLVEHLSLEKFNLQECCFNKWQQISNCNLRSGILTAQQSEEWFKCRQFRITGSTCYSVFTFSSKYSDERWGKKTSSCFFPKSFSNKYVRHGNENEGNALLAYQAGTTDTVIKSFGFVICKHFPWLGFSPDAVVVENGIPIKLVEIKCPYSAKTGAATSFASCDFLVNLNEGIQLKKKHAYYGQIQLGLAILNLKICDFIVYSSSSNTFLKLEIPFDPVFAKKLILTVSEKYFSKMLHFLCKDD